MNSINNRDKVLTEAEENLEKYMNNTINSIFDRLCTKIEIFCQIFSSMMKKRL